MKKVNSRNRWLLRKRWLTYICAALLAFILAFACVGCSNTESPPENSNDSPENSQPSEPPSWASNFDLPDADAALAKLREIYGGEDKLFLLRNNQIARMPCPQGELITINVTFDVGEYAKLVLEDSVAEFNEVFGVINPNYEFSINYNPTPADLAQKYSVKLTQSDNLGGTETSEVFGVAHVNYYNSYTELGDFGITVKTDVFNNGSYLLTTFKHELMHLLGAGDAYKNSAATKNTVMQSYTVNGYHSLSSTDVAFLDALYRNPEFAEDGEIPSYVEDYEQNCAHTRANLVAATYNKLVDDIDTQELMNQASAMGYKDLTDFFATVSGGLTRDVTFGGVNESFKEIEYLEAQDETYFGSIDAQNNKYWHGEQKGSMGNSSGIGYVNYGNGIVYAAPNGNKYTIMIKTGDFVLAFRLGGSFTNLADLSLTLWHISK